MKTNTIYDKLLRKFAVTSRPLTTWQIARWADGLGCTEESAVRISRDIARAGENRGRGARLVRLTKQDKLDLKLKTKYCYFKYLTK